MSTARKWPYKANSMRENAIARMLDIEKTVKDSLASARQRGDADEILRLSLVMQQAQATKYEMQLAYYAGRE